MISERRLISTFLQLVRINAPAKAERPILKFLKRQLSKFPMREDRAGKAIGGNCGNLIVRVSGDHRPTVLLSAHMDTVRPTTGIRPIIKKGVIRTDGKTILGADDRAGIAVILELIRHLEESKLPHPPLELVFTVAEEIGLQGARRMRRSSLRSKLGYILDSSLPVGAAVHRSVTIQRMHITVRGRAAHAGVDPERGINAIWVAAKALARLKTGRIGRHTTLNIGTVAGGHAFNIVPDQAHVVLEIRSASERVLHHHVRRVKNAFHQAAKAAGARVKIQEQTDFRLFRVSPRAPVARFFSQAARRVGIRPLLCQYGGGSDGNVFNRMGIPCLVLGLGYESPHTTRERLPIRNLTRATRLLSAILQTCK